MQLELAYNPKAEPSTKKGKKGLPREYFMNSGGWFPHPDLDRERFNELPGWRQAEILECQRIFREVPGVQAYEIHDPSTGKPYPNQKLVEHYLRKEETVAALPEPPAAVKYNIPNGINLATFRKHRVEYQQPSLEAVAAHASTMELKLGIRKPVDGIHAFIWRLARYNIGLDRSVPVSVFWDLEDGIFLLTGIRGGATEDVVRLLEKRAGDITEAAGGNRHAGAIKWARYLGRTV